MRIIKTDDYDENQWLEALDASPSLHRLWMEARDRAETASDLLADVFQLLYQALPSWAVGSRPTLQEYLLREIEGTQEFRALRSLAADDAANSTMATAILGRRLLSKVGEDMADALADEGAKASAMEEAEAHLEALRGLGNPEDPAIAEAVAAAEAAAMQARQDLDALGSPEQFEEAIGRLRREVREAAAEAQADLSRLAEAEATLGGGASTSIEAKLRLAERLERSPKLSQLVEMAGRIRRIALAKRTSVLKSVPPEVVGIGLGADVARAIPSELALLADDSTRPIFYRKLIERQLLQLEQQGEERLGGGPIIVLVDGSGSMAGARETWAKAVALGFLAIAERERRDVLVCQFGGAGHQVVHEFLYRTRPRGVTRDDVLEAVERFLNASSTDLEGPLRWAASRIAEDGAMDAADVIAVTDAEVSFSPGFLDAWHADRKRLGFHSFGVVIGSPEAASTLSQAIEQVAALSDLADDGQALTTLFGRPATAPVK